MNLVNKKTLEWINLGLIGTTVFFLFLTAITYFSRPSEIKVKDITQKKTSLPKGDFILDEEAYEAIGPPFMELNYSPMTLQLPNLKTYLVYYGRNDRPDAPPEEALLHFGFSGSKGIESVPAEKPLYLVYDKDRPRIKYLFSPENKETSLWIEGYPREEEILVRVAMKNESGEIIRKPEQNAEFTLKERPFARFGMRSSWELGKWRVDGTLLARQKAKWYGQDIFLERHGGEEFAEISRKQRIDFGEGEERYSLFLQEGDGAIWLNDRWVQVELGEQSRKYPLLAITKVDERLLKLNVWDEEGKTKVGLNLIKSASPKILPNIEKTFKFVGARTRTQFMFDIQGKRILIRPKDWLLFYEGEWVKLTEPQDIDAFVERKIVGPLFIIEEISQEEGRQVLVGTLYDEARTDAQQITIPLQQGPFVQPIEEETQEEKADIKDQQAPEKPSKNLEKMMNDYRRLGEM